MGHLAIVVKKYQVTQMLYPIGTSVIWAIVTKKYQEPKCCVHSQAIIDNCISKTIMHLAIANNSQCP